MVEATNGTLCHIQCWQLRKYRHRNRGQDGQAPNNFEVHGGAPLVARNKPRLTKVCIPFPPPRQYWQPSYARAKLLPSALVAYQNRRSQYLIEVRVLALWVTYQSDRGMTYTTCIGKHLCPEWHTKPTVMSTDTLSDIQGPQWWVLVPWVTHKACSGEYWVTNKACSSEYWCSEWRTGLFSCEYWYPDWHARHLVVGNVILTAIQGLLWWVMGPEWHTRSVGVSTGTLSYLQCL